VTILKQFKN